jgi:hypothetical protein
MTLVGCEYQPWETTVLLLAVRLLAGHSQLGANMVTAVPGSDIGGVAERQPFMFDRINHAKPLPGGEFCREMVPIENQTAHLPNSRGGIDSKGAPLGRR